jgi:hypothetical protein
MRTGFAGYAAAQAEAAHPNESAPHSRYTALFQHFINIFSLVNYQ